MSKGWKYYLTLALWLVIIFFLLALVPTGIPILLAIVALPCIYFFYRRRKRKTTAARAEAEEVPGGSTETTVHSSADSSIELVPSTRNETAESLVKLVSLRSKNLITDEEYQAKRRAILDRL